MPRAAALLAAATVAVLVAFGLQSSGDPGASARVALRDVDAGPGRHVEATLTVSPADAAEGAAWFDVTAWQGGSLVVDPLREIGPGRYRTTEPIPVSGNWKAMVRLHEGDVLSALPIFLPRDAAIPVGEIPARRSFSRAFGDEHRLLQREQTGGSPLLVALAYSTVAAITLSLLALLAWALHRLAGGGRSQRRRRLAGRPARLQHQGSGR